MLVVRKIFVGLIIGLLVGMLFNWKLPLAHAAAPVELKVYPKKAWDISVSPNILIAVRGINGFSGNATVTFSNIPASASITCNDLCTPGLGSEQFGPTTTFTIKIVNGEWRSFAPNVSIPRPTGSNPTPPPDNYNGIKVTVSTSGYDSVTDTFNLKVEPQSSKAEVQLVIPTDGSPVFSPSSDQNITAGTTATTKTYTAKWQIGGFINSWNDGDTVTFAANEIISPSFYDGSIAYGIFPNPLQSFKVGEQKSIDFQVNVNENTPAGIYTFILGMKESGGYQTSPTANVLLRVNPAQTSSSSSSSSSSSTTTTETSTTPSTSSSASSTSSPTVSKPQPADISVVSFNIVQKPIADVPMIFLRDSSATIIVKPDNKKTVKKITITNPFTGEVMDLKKTSSGNYELIFTATAEPKTYSGKLNLEYTDGTTEMITLDFLIKDVGQINLAKQPDMPIENAQATLLVKQNDAFVIWDGTPYDQINPLLTNTAGQYAYVVPAGIYKIQAEKTGFETFLSEELTVSLTDVINLLISLTESANIITPVTPTVETKTQEAAPIVIAALQQAQKVLAPVVEEPLVQVSNNVATTTTAVLAASSVAVPALMNIAPWEMLARALAWLGSLFAFWKRKKIKPWGQVRDGESGQPIALANVRIFDQASKRLLETVRTDEKGRFGFLVNPGDYYLEVEKTGYTFPSKLTSEGYHKTTLSVKKDLVLNLDIPIDPDLKRVTSFVKSLNSIHDFVNWLRLPVLIIGTIFSIIFLIVNPSLPYLLILLAYLLIWVFDLYQRFFLPRAYGKVMDAMKNLGLDLALVRVFSNDGKLISTRVSSKVGSFYLLLNPGSYRSKITRMQYKPSDEELKIIKATNINKNFPLRPE